MKFPVENRWNCKRVVFVLGWEEKYPGTPKRIQIEDANAVITHYPDRIEVIKIKVAPVTLTREQLDWATWMGRYLQLRDESVVRPPK
jgi:hypothetical protein